MGQRDKAHVVEVQLVGRCAVGKGRPTHAGSKMGSENRATRGTAFQLCQLLNDAGCRFHGPCQRDTDGVHKSIARRKQSGFGRR